MGSTGDGYASCLCFVCDAANAGVVVTPDSVREYLGSLPQSDTNYIDLSPNAAERLPTQESIMLNGKKLTFGEKLIKAFTINRPRKAAPNRASIEQVQSKRRESVFASPIGASMNDIDAKLEKDKIK